VLDRSDDSDRAELVSPGLGTCPARLLNADAWPAAAQAPSIQGLGPGATGDRRRWSIERALAFVDARRCRARGFRE
jgi:hypothetical protein